MGRTERTRRASTIGLLALILLVAACGSDGEDQVGTAPTLAEAAPTSTDDPSSDSSSGSTATTASAEDDDRVTASTTSTTSDSPPTTEPTSSSTTEPTSTSGRDGPELVDVRSVPIFSIRSLGPSTLELTVEGGVEPCFIIDRVEVVEASDQVELTVNAGSEPDAICIQIIELHTTTVELADPLGGRDVVDGTTGQPIDVAS